MYGVAVSGNSGQLSSHGVEGSYSYDGTTLSVTVDSAPWYMGGVDGVSSIVKSKIDDIVS
jgi:hypothetical protein